MCSLVSLRSGLTRRHVVDVVFRCVRLLAGIVVELVSSHDVRNRKQASIPVAKAGTSAAGGHSLLADELGITMTVDASLGAFGLDARLTLHDEAYDSP